MKVKVILDRKVCTGAGACMKENPALFQLVGKKAVLRDGEKKGSLMVATTNDVKKAVNAAHACPVNAIRVVDMKTKKELVRTKVTKKASRKIAATYDESREWVMDKKGYFLIRIVPEKELIEVAHCSLKNEIDVVISGKSATEIFNTIIREKLVDSLQHAAYLGKELYKAKICLVQKKRYVQDDVLFRERFD